MSFYCDLFKKAFPKVNAVSIVAQLSSGSTYFNYNVLGTNATETEGDNVVSGFVSDTPDKCINAKTVNWVASDGRIVSTVYRIGLKAPAPSPDAVSNPVLAETIAPFVLVDGVYVAQVKDAWSSPAHIETVNGIDYLVSYSLSKASGLEININKHKIALDMSVDQRTITVMPIEKFLTLNDASGASWTYTQYSIDNPFGDLGSSGAEYEYNFYHVMHERNLVSNNSGKKTIFSYSRRYTISQNVYEYKNVVIELTDIDTGDSQTTVFDAAELYEFTNSTIPSSNESYSDFGSGTRTTTTTETLINCPQPDTDLDGVISGSFNGGLTSTGYKQGESKTYYLGCAYDRKTDTPIICYLEKGYGIKNQQITMDASWSGTSHNSTDNFVMDGVVTRTSNYLDNDGTIANISKIIILNANTGAEIRRDYDPDSSNTANLTTTSQGYYPNGNTGLNYHYDANYKFDYVASELLDFNIISLANRCYVLKEKSFDVHLDVDTTTDSYLCSFGDVGQGASYANSFSPYQQDSFDIVSDDVFNIIQDGVKTEIFRNSNQIQSVGAMARWGIEDNTDSTHIEPPGGVLDCNGLLSIDHVNEVTMIFGGGGVC